jgi:hypothetical protein
VRETQASAPNAIIKNTRHNTLKFTALRVFCPLPLPLSEDMAIAKEQAKQS